MDTVDPFDYPKAQTAQRPRYYQDSLHERPQTPTAETMDSHNNSEGDGPDNNVESIVQSVHVSQHTCFRQSCHHPTYEQSQNKQPLFLLHDCCDCICLGTACDRN